MFLKLPSLTQISFTNWSQSYFLELFFSLYCFIQSQWVTGAPPSHWPFVLFFFFSEGEGRRKSSQFQWSDRKHGSFCISTLVCPKRCLSLFLPFPPSLSASYPLSLLHSSYLYLSIYLHTQLINGFPRPPTSQLCRLSYLCG